MQSHKVIQDIASKEQFNEIVGKPTLSVIHFMTPWAPIVRSTDDVIADLSASPELKDVVFGTIDAEGLNGEISLKYNVSCVPTVLFFKGGNVIDRIDGVHPSEIAKKVLSHANKPNVEPISTQNNSDARPAGKDKVLPLEERIKELLSAKVIIFMKGDPETPRCGFSRTLIGIMQQSGLPFETYDILKDEELRQGLKTYSNWQTYPQLYVDGELVGGLDIINELKESGELMTTLQGKS